MDTSIVSIGLANPGPPILQNTIAGFMKKAHGLEKDEARKLDFLYKKSGIRTRHSVLEDFDKTENENFKFFPESEDLEPFPGTKARMQVFRDTAPELCENAVKNCLEKVKSQADNITHLVLVSCTGMIAPGVELDMMCRLGL